MDTRRDDRRCLLTLVTDALALVGAASVVLLGPGTASPAAVAAYPPAVLGLLACTHRYRRRLGRSVADELFVALAAAAAGALLMSAGAELVGGAPLTGRETLRLWIVAALGLTATHLVVASVVAVARQRGALTSPTLIIGAGRVGHVVARRLLERPQLGSLPIGFLDRDPIHPPHRAAGLPVLGSSDDLERVVGEHSVAHVVIAFSTATDEALLSLARRCGQLGVDVSVVPRLFEVAGARPSGVFLGGVPLVELSFDDPDRPTIRFKYAVDRTVAALAWLALSPLLAAIAIAVRITMGRPILHRQARVGRGGAVFSMLKFRTMTGRPESDGEADAAWLESVLGTSAAAARESKRADRTTALGRFLRRTSLDELPQLWNVVRGDMSLVGPRPERSSYVDRLSPAVYRYPERHRLKPGITGWAQVNGLRGRTSLEDRVEWDNYYVDNWSWRLDFAIVARTIACVIGGSPEDGMSARRPRRGRRWLSRVTVRISGLFVLALVVLAAFASVAPAATGSGQPSAADQYIEELPSIDGSVPLEPGGDGSSGGGSSTRGGGSSGGGGAGAVPLSPFALRQLRTLGGPTATALRTLATSPALGAPHPPAAATTRTRGLLAGRGAAVSTTNPRSATTGVLVWLVIALVATTLIAVVIANHDRRQRRQANP